LESAKGIPSDVAEAMRIASAARTTEQANLVTSYYRKQDSELLRLTKAAEDHAKTAPKRPDSKVQVVTQRGEPRESRILVRGDFLNPGESVQPAGPAWLPPVRARAQRPDRLDLASWLVSSENPLPARVAANRWWDKLFGRGLVRTVDDFGKQGESPSHPELLDWLAVEFRESGWSLKQLIRQIVTSNTYRQSSAVRAELLARDPENMLLARQSRRRVESELIRDLSLAASGLLDSRIGGPSVRPPQPKEYASLTYSNSAKWQESEGGDRYRRGLYTFFQRTSPYPMLMTFDSPDSNETCARRESSNTPLQALTLWNDPAFFECAQALGKRITAEVPASGDDQLTVRHRMSYAFALCLNRIPESAEFSEMERLYAGELARYLSQPDAATAAVGSGSLPPGSPAAEVAAWTVVGRVLLNLDEFITRE
jgi:hypothetical protein